MRIMRKKLDPKVERALKLLTPKYWLDDDGLVLDLFVLVRQVGAGIPTDERIDTIAAAMNKGNLLGAVTLRLLMKRRAQVFRDLAKLAYFKSLSISQAANPLDATDRLLAQFRKFGRKMRTMQCTNCPLRVAENCRIGKVYAETAQDVTAIALKDAATSLPAGCPHRDAIIANSAMLANTVDFLSQVEDTDDAAALALNDMYNGTLHDTSQAVQDKVATSNDADGSSDPDAESDFETVSGSGASLGGNTYGSFLGSNVNVTEKMLDRLTSAHLALFEIGRVLDQLLSGPGIEKFSPTENVGRSQRAEAVESVADLGDADAEEFVADANTLLNRTVKGAVGKSQDMQPQQKAQMLYLLVDNSASMMSQVGQFNLLGAVSRISFSAVFGSALARKVGREKGRMCFRLFGSGVGPLHTATNPEDFEMMQRMLAKVAADGGGTNMAAALYTAFEDIQRVRKDLAKAEVLLITDGDAGSRLSKSLALRGDIRLSILDVSGSTGLCDTAKELMSHCSAYFSVDPAAPDLGSIVKTLFSKDTQKK